MQLKGEQLAAHLERELKPVYVVYGDDPLLVIEAADAIRAAARRRGFDERKVLTALAGFNWVELHHAAGNMSLFGGRTLIDLRIPTGKPGREGSAAIQDYCARQSPDALLLVTLPGLEWTEEKAAWLKALAEAGVAVKLIPPNLAELPAWIAGRLQRQQQSADREGLRFIAERVEGNLLAAHQEILKLGLLHPPGDLSLDDVRGAVLNVARYNVDKLRQALLDGDPARCARLLEGLKGEGEAPLLVLWALTSEIRSLANLRQGLDDGQPLPALLKAERVFDERRKQGVQRALPRLPSSALRTAILHAARIDRMIKGLTGGDVWDEFLQLALRLARRG